MDLTDRELPRRVGLQRNNSSVKPLLSKIGGVSRSTRVSESSVSDVGSQTRRQNIALHNRSTLSTSSDYSSRPQAGAGKTRRQPPTVDGAKVESTWSNAGGNASRRSTSVTTKRRRAVQEQSTIGFAGDELTKSTGPLICGVAQDHSIRYPFSAHASGGQLLDSDGGFEHIHNHPSPPKQDTGKTARILQSAGTRSTRNSTQRSDDDRETKALLAKTHPKSAAHIVAGLHNVGKGPGEMFADNWVPKRRRIIHTYSSQRKNYKPPAGLLIEDELDCEFSSSLRPEYPELSLIAGDDEPNKPLSSRRFGNSQNLHALPPEKPQSPPKPTRLINPTDKLPVPSEDGYESSGGPERYRNLSSPSLPPSSIPEPKVFINPFHKFGKANSEIGPPNSPNDKLDGINAAGNYEKKWNSAPASSAGSRVGGVRKRKAVFYGSSQENQLYSGSPTQYRDNVEFSSTQILPGESPHSSNSGPQLLYSMELRDVCEMMGQGPEESELKDKSEGGRKGCRPDEYCKLCEEPLPIGYLDAWRDENGNLKRIKMEKWSEICSKHKKSALEKEWEDKGYPDIDWANLKKRVNGYNRLLVDIIEDNIPSPFRKVFAQQQKETGGNVAKLLRRDAQLQYPGYYGPRGSNILLHTITMNFGTRVGDAAKSDSLIRRGGVAAFIQTVLVPELAVRLIMEDMSVLEEEARKILEKSRDIGEKLNMEESPTDIYDDDDSGWLDVNSVENERLMAERRTQEYMGDEDEDDPFI